MRRDELEELHYITKIANVSSICRFGILSHERVQKMKHESVAMADIQERRSKKAVPGGLPLHDYVPLYFSARNPMLFKILRELQVPDRELCILKVSPQVVDLPGVVVSDSNAAGNLPRFAAAPRGLEIVNRDLTFARYWTDDDPTQYHRKKLAKCAEALVPHKVHPKFILGAYVSCPASLGGLSSLGTDFSREINPPLFFL